MKIYRKAAGEPSSSGYSTNDGRPITFVEKPFAENKDRRGWVCHNIYAYVDGVEAGYIKMSYIPKEKWDEIYKGNLWRFRCISLGHSDMPEEILDDKQAIYNRVKTSYPYFGDPADWMDYEEKKTKKEYDSYYQYFVDKPIVDFIRTYDGVYDGKGGPNFRRQGIALALHKYASQWLQQTFGLKLWMSYCRSQGPNGSADMYQHLEDTGKLPLKKHKYRNKLSDGFRREREYVANSAGWYKVSQSVPFKDNIIDPNKPDHGDESQLIDPNSREYDKRIETLFDRTDHHFQDIMRQFYDKKRKKKSMMSWTVIPKSRLKRIWLDYGKLGFVRDTKGMQEIADQMIDILARLRASNDLSGHGQMSDETVEEYTGYKMPKSKNRSEDFYWHYLETPYGTPISDYGLPKLEHFASNLMRSVTAEQQLFWVDRMLNVIHQRGDLAALFIEGGAATLSEIALQ